MIETPDFARLIMKEGPTPGEVFPLRGDEIRLGRGRGLDITIDSPGVSRLHACIRREGHQHQLEDAGSSNGTYLNGQRLTEPCILGAGDTIRLGAVILFEYQPDQAEATRIDHQKDVSSTIAENMLEPNVTMVGEEEFSPLRLPHLSCR
jgi:pSer/pThr/pTyr-binding forkhead associated (FHA) protein